MNTCIFCGIINKKVPSQIIFEDNDCIAFPDISPKAGVHILLIPKVHFKSLNNAPNDVILGKMMTHIKTITKEKGIADGYKIMINSGRKGGQTVDHFHIHILGGTGLERVSAL